MDRTTWEPLKFVLALNKYVFLSGLTADQDSLKARASERACLMRLVRIYQFGDRQCLLDVKNHLLSSLSGGHSLINLNSNVQTQKCTDDYCK